jgi:hypothetical protein
MDYAARLRELGFHPPEEPARGDVAAIEEAIGVAIPAPYRRFLAECGGWCGDRLCPCDEPTPFGEEHWLREFHDAAGVHGLLDSMITPRNMITIGTGHFAKYLCLSIAGIDRGADYALDGEQRGWWDDETFHARYNAMADSIREYLDLRERDELPDKPAGYDHIYRLAGDFDEFLTLCRRDDD